MTQAERKELDEDWADFLVGIESLRIRRRWAMGVCCATAALALAIVLTFPSFYRKDVRGNDVLLSSYEKNILLPDGTQVCLSPGSRLFYPEVFNGDTREVKLDGEAYFEVKSSPEHPFLVHLEGGVVKVTGTRFTATSYPGDKELKVSLDEGKVELSIDGQEPIEMHPSQEVSYDRSEKKMLDSHLVFKDCRMEDILKSVCAIYGLKFEFRRDDLRDVRLSFRIPEYNDASALETLIGIVCRTNARIENGIIFIG